MTSEVLMLNKDAVVIAADSAVTTGTDPHPRYSKAANKIFDLSIHGNVAVTIFGAAEVDKLPWELVLKQYRKDTGQDPQLDRLEDYVGSLTQYLQNNPRFFPEALLSENLKSRFFRAAGHVLDQIGDAFPDFIDEAKDVALRVQAWIEGQAAIAQFLAGKPFQGAFEEADHQIILRQRETFAQELTPIVQGHSKFAHADINQLVPLAVECLLKQPTEFLASTGLVFAGYGANEIFPSFVHIEIYGHLGEKLLWSKVNSYSITHVNDALILPFAQSAMIDRFTDGFDGTLNRIIHQGSLGSFNQIISDLQAEGIEIAPAVSEAIVGKRHSEFMAGWKSKNWEVNFHPLRRVLNSLSVPEMGHLAESLLVLEELRERVTSPSESVGGPIDVAAVTKAEGLLWLKRKHFFEPELNQRYLGRIRTDYNKV